MSKPRTYRCAPGYEFEFPINVELSPGQYVYVEIAGPLNIVYPAEFTFPSTGMTEREGLRLVRFAVPDYLRPGSYGISKFQIRGGDDEVIFDYPPGEFSDVYIEILDAPPESPGIRPEVTIGD
jgi:hypothetical protein